MGILWRIVVIGSIAMLLSAAGCTGCDDEVGGITSDRCPDAECVECETHDDCDDGAYCGVVDDHDVCVVQECEPDAAHCEDGAVVQCDADGTGYLDPVDCPFACENGSCQCDEAEDCPDGAECTDDNDCACAYGDFCGDLCCGDGEVCEQTEVCDGDDCQMVPRCQPECAGEFCGPDGTICCEGDTPVCGPHGDCAPDCSDAGEVCGEDFNECCDTGDVCSFGGCVTPGDACDDVFDCGFGEYCDEALGQCMPDDFPDDIECRMEGEFDDLEAEEKWSWTDEDIISIPVVGDVTGDGEPNVIVNSTRVDGGSWPRGNIHILDSGGEELHKIEHDPGNETWGSHGRSNIALGDVTGDGRMEILYASRRVSGSESFIVAANGEGETVWRAHDENGDPVTDTLHNGGITVANFDGDTERAEVVVGGMLVDSDGQIVWHDKPSTPYGTNHGYTGGVPVVADITGDGTQEIVTGRHAWTVDWENTADGPAVEVDQLWVHDGPDGYPAVADIDGDGTPEVVLVASSTVRVLEGDTGKLWCGIDPTGEDCEEDDALRTQPVSLPGPSSNNRGGPPTVADFDGDQRPEIGVAGGHYYAVFDIYRTGFGDDDTPEDIDEDLLEQFDQPDPEPGEIFIRWQRETQDLSSNATGSSVFDFQGDGSASVVYGDECFLRVYSGVDGEYELEIMNSTGTILEYPIVVDVDENGRSEILVVANDIDHCSNLFDDYETRQGLFVYEDPNERWVHTRSIWNQHAYSIDNILDDGTLPDDAPRWWETHNSFRNNRQGEVPLNAPDVVVSSLQTNALSCPPHFEIRATIENHGMAAIPAGLPVGLFDGNSGELLESTTVDEIISPGGLAVVEFEYAPVEYNTPLQFVVAANDEEIGEGVLSEDCNPQKAMSETFELECSVEL